MVSVDAILGEQLSCGIGVPFLPGPTIAIDPLLDCHGIPPSPDPRASGRRAELFAVVARIVQRPR
jgi:hypothetical protein